MEPTMKTCGKCGEKTPDMGFYPVKDDAASNDYRRHYCKKCIRRPHPPPRPLASGWPGAVLAGGAIVWGVA
jgi:hypothetical protein